MPFDWLEPHVPESVRAEDPTRRRQGCENDVRVRAALLQRLGREQDAALQRCLGNLAWAYELAGSAPLTSDEVRALVAEVYARRPAT